MSKTTDPGVVSPAEFILARLADDEAAALARMPRGARRNGKATQRRVLAQVAAFRAIVEIHEWQLTTYYGPCAEPCCAAKVTRYICAQCGGLPDEPCPTLRALAQVYVDHPDFDPAWLTS